MQSSSVPSPRRLLAAAAGVVLLAGLLPVQAQAAPTPAPAGAGAPTGGAARGEERGDYDSRKAAGASSAITAKRAAAVARPAAAVRKLRSQLGVQSIVDIDPATGTPRRVARLDGFLTKASRKAPATIALDYVRTHADVFGLDKAGVAGLKLRRDYVDVAGIRHLSFVQSVGGVPVFGNGLKAHVARDGRLIQVDGSPVAKLPKSAGAAALTAEKARAAAVADVFGTSRQAVTKRAAGAVRKTTFADGGQAQLVVFQTADGPRLAWQTIVMDEGYLHVLDAQSGEVLYRQHLVSHDTGHAWENYPGAPVGGTQKRVDLSRPGWLPNDSPWLAGNVAHVYTDVNDDNVANRSEEVRPNGPRKFEYKFKDFTAQVGAPCSARFKCSWDPDVPNSWRANREQNAVQLFYFLGTFHDHLKAAPIGFTRAAGNFEAVDGDAVQGEAMDGANTANGRPDPAHVNNANMATPPDGIAPRMQMYLFHDPADDSAPAANSGDTADIVYHEYVHGLSNRLVVDANGASTLGDVQAGAMGEAWSDWYAMDFLVGKGLEKDTTAAGELRIGKYVTGGGTIRTIPMDCSVGSTAAVCGGTPTAGPGGYTYGDFGRIIGRPQVHADGEIWSQTLWDLRKAVGTSPARSLVTRGMELAPANPSYLDMRNSILQADTVVNRGKYRAKIWQVFAGRGMGWFAGSIDGDDTQPIEDFSTPPSANSPRGSLTGKVTDTDTGAPIAGAVVGFGGHTSGFGGDYVATTAADGTYTISGIIPGTYPKVFARGPGYDTSSQTVSVAARANTVNWTVRRDWAALAGGSRVVTFNGEDNTESGCGPRHLFDQSQGTGWVSNVVFTTGTAIEPRFVVVRLPVAVTVAEIAVNPTPGCGLAGSASTGDYRVETSTDGTTWTVAAGGHFGPADRNRMNSVPLAAGSTANVQYVRYTMLSNQLADVGGTCPGAFSGCDYVGATELAVYGTAATAS